MNPPRGELYTHHYQIIRQTRKHVHATFSMYNSNCLHGLQKHRQATGAHHHHHHHGALDQNVDRKNEKVTLSIQLSLSHTYTKINFTVMLLLHWEGLLSEVRDVDISVGHEFCDLVLTSDGHVHCAHTTLIVLVAFTILAMPLML